MNKIPDGGNAFPLNDSRLLPSHGVSKRELFALAALVGLRSSPASIGYSSDAISDWAFRDADAMIKAGKGGNS